MFDKSNAARFKSEARVIVTLTGQEPFDAIVFLKVGERLIDLLNDDRRFLPVRREDDTTLIVAKASIVSIYEHPDPIEEEAAKAEDTDASDTKDEEEQRERKSFRPRRSFNPYHVLRIEPDASMEEIRHAYTSRMKAVHPDAIAALDLDEDLARAALLTAQKVNFAYDLIMRERERLRKAMEEDEEQAAAEARKTSAGANDGAPQRAT